MSLDQRKYERKHTDLLRDIRPVYARIGDWFRKPSQAFALFLMAGAVFIVIPQSIMFADFLMIIFGTTFWILVSMKREPVFKYPADSRFKDPRNMGAGRDGKPQGILYLGNIKETNEEIWFTNSDARTHILYLGTTGSGKTEGLKSIVTNALAWGSGFVYIDGKADTDLWSSLSALVRRFGRDDDLLVLNYMTGNSDARAPSNTMNPFSSGSASYLTNMLVSLMPEAEGDNAMWKERAVSLISSLMPALTWKRDNQDIPLSVSTIRDYLNLNNIIKLSRDDVLPKNLREGIKGYLDTLPGYVDGAFDDNGKEKPMGPDQPAVDTTTVRQQHGYLTMQFTRSLQSLGDDYGYIFDTQAADVDMVDVVLNRRILIVLIPALEKSSDETANLGKIVAATLKGMMGSTLGATVEGESSTVIENKPTNSATPFICIFDEVGYYVQQGMAVMAAQARSLGFSLVFSSQDIAAMEKRVKEEARSITGNCNIKLFGKLEDPMNTKEFFDKIVGSALVIETSGYSSKGGVLTSSYFDGDNASSQSRSRSSYDTLRNFKEGEAVICFADRVMDCKIFYSNPGHAKAMRVTRYISLPPPDEQLSKHSKTITALRDKLVGKTWTAMGADVAAATPDPIDALVAGYGTARKKIDDGVDFGIAALSEVHARQFPDEATQAMSGAAAPQAATTPPMESPAPAPDMAPAELPKVPATPLGFFAKKGEDAAPADVQDKPADIAEIPAMAENAPQTVRTTIAKLDADVDAILREAGKNARSLFSGKTGDE